MEHGVKGTFLISDCEFKNMESAFNEVRTRSQNPDSSILKLVFWLLQKYDLNESDGVG